jgi:integrase
MVRAPGPWPGRAAGAIGPLRERWVATRKAVGLDLRFHDLRHAFASALIAQGCDVVTVSHAMGHATPSITLNVYGHLWPSGEDRYPRGDRQGVAAS